MKIGIITVFAVPNYGAMLQSYALCSYLKQQGHKAEIIDYRQPDLTELYRFRRKFPPALKHWFRLRKCASFVNRCIPRSKRQYHSVETLLHNVEDYDCLITGSDQVWFTGPVQYYEPFFFLDFPSVRARKVSYSASAGGVESFDPFAERVRKALAGFSHIGVRDSHTASLVKGLTEKAVTETVDPTFLVDFEELHLASQPENDPYIVVFGNFNATPSIIEEVRQSTGIKTIVSLQYPCAAATTRIASPSPVDWLHWIRHASFVVTSYFHGTALAVHYARPFIAIPTPGRLVKVKTLLAPLGLSARCIDNPGLGEAGELAAQDIDWREVKRLLGGRIQESKSFLQRALS